MNQTFAWAVFLGNGLMAILAGFFGDFLVEKMDLGRVAPFDAAIVFMLIGGAVMMATWPENYGDSGSKNLSQQFEKAWHAITTGGRVGGGCLGCGEGVCLLLTHIVMEGPMGGWGRALPRVKLYAQRKESGVSPTHCVCVDDDGTVVLGKPCKHELRGYLRVSHPDVPCCPCWLCLHQQHMQGASGQRPFRIIIRLLLDSA